GGTLGLGGTLVRGAAAGALVPEVLVRGDVLHAPQIRLQDPLRDLRVLPGDRLRGDRRADRAVHLQSRTVVGDREVVKREKGKGRREKGSTRRPLLPSPFSLLTCLHHPLAPSCSTGATHMGIHRHW